MRGDAQIFGLLDRYECAVQVLAQRLFQEIGRPRRLDRGAPVHRHGRACDGRFVAVADGFRAGIETFVETLGNAGQHGRCHQIGIGVDTGRPVLDAPVFGIARWHAQRHRTVVDAPGPVSYTHLTLPTIYSV